VGKAVSSQNAKMFRHDPKARTAYLAMQVLLANPHSPIAPALWADVEAASSEVTVGQWVADLMAWGSDSSDFLPD
jgi:hypothetical protein